jgi:hypothetical protein
MIGEKRSLAFYALGVSYYAEIYFGFEEAWKELENIRSCATQPSHYPSDSACEKKIGELSALLSMDELRRTGRLKADIEWLCSYHPVIAHLVAEGMHARKIREEIQCWIMERRHTLLAYVWVLYSALFNGGQFIRRQIIRAGPKFWGLTTIDDISSFPEPLSFWSVNDEPAFRDKFRSRVNEAGNLLTNKEKDDVIAESVWIILRCKEITEELDERTINWLASGPNVADGQSTTPLNTPNTPATITKEIL